jgi:hypothetical protein
VLGLKEQVHKGVKQVFATLHVSHKIVCDTFLSQTTRHYKASLMPRPTPTQELDSLLELIGIAADGVGIDTIAQQWGTPIQRRTLQRRLALLVAQQRIEMLGDRRTARYRRAASAAIRAQEPEAPWRTAPPSDDLPVSVAGAEVRAYVTQPRHLRSPVAYRQSFLEQYQPN